MTPPRGWSQRPLGACAQWLSGGTPRKSTPEYWDGEIPWISAKSLKRFYVEDAEQRVTELGAENGTRLVNADTILFIVRGMSLKTEFRVGITRRPVTFNQDLKALVAKPGIDPLFLANAIRAHTSEILGLVDEAGHGTGRLQTDLLEALEMPLPPIDEQRRIAAVLGALDDKIELNRKMNRTLEEMAQAIFKSWFIDFDGVDASEMVDSELGPIPKGWKASVLGDHVSLRRGKTYKSKLLGQPGPVLLGLASIHRDGGFRRDKLRTYGGDSPSEILVPPGSLFVSLKDVTQAGDLLGSVARLPSNIESGRLTQDTVRLVFQPGAAPESYIYWLLRTPSYRSYCRGRATGTTNLGLSRSDFLSFPVVLPPRALLEEWVRTEAALSDRAELALIESETLSNIRDTLLPKLISGEVRVPEQREKAET